MREMKTCYFFTRLQKRETLGGIMWQGKLRGGLENIQPAEIYRQVEG